MTDSSAHETEAMIVRGFDGGVIEEFGRMAIVTHNARGNAAVTHLLSKYDTYHVTTLSELRVALSLRENSVAAIVVVNISDMPDCELEVFSSFLPPHGGFGNVYIMRPEQFAFFAPGTFGFVVR
jgi:hypothetical protein